MGVTNWDKIVSGCELTKAMAIRSKTFITSKERIAALNDLKEEGWEYVRTYSDNKYISVKKNKPNDEIFEDKVWSLFVKMGFTHLNADRHFVLNYDTDNPSALQQIDVFAADEESIIIVECKSSNSSTPKEGVFKKEIEALHGQMEGITKEARKQFPGRKIKFIWATNNYILSKTDQQRLKDWGIFHFNEAVINYYIGLTKHLGSSAKYQLLGNIFANTEIKNMEDKIPAIQGKMGGFEYYSFSIEPERLLKIGYVLHRKEANKNMMPTYQRLIKKKRLQDIKKFVNDGGYFPNSVIISIDTNGRGLRFEQAGNKVDNCISKLGVLYLPKRYRSAYIIDGQHRLYGYSDSFYAKSNTIPVVAFVDLDRNEQIKLFMDINENQKAVPKYLRIILNSDMLWESPKLNERRKALRSKIAQMLGEEETSPLFNRILMEDDVNKTVTKCITIEAIQTALNRCDFFTEFDNKNKIVRDGTFDLGENQTTCDFFYPFLEECLKYVMLNADNAWSNGDQEYGIVTINRGIQALIRVINDIVNHLKINCNKNPKEEKRNKYLTEVKYYLDPLIDYFVKVTIEQRKELRNHLGGSADTRFWRTFQNVIAETRKDFEPDGLSKYWNDQNKLYNQESLQFLMEIKRKVKAIIESELENKYGKGWLISALPREIYRRAESAASDRNYDLILSGAQDEEITLWECVTLSECKSIVLSGSHWRDHFNKLLVRPEEEKLQGDKESKTEWITKIDNTLTKLQNANYSVTEEEYNLIKSVYFWLFPGI